MTIIRSMNTHQGKAETSIVGISRRVPSGRTGALRIPDFEHECVDESNRRAWSEIELSGQCHLVKYSGHINHLRDIPTVLSIQRNDACRGMLGEDMTLARTITASHFR